MKLRTSLTIAFMLGWVSSLSAASFDQAMAAFSRKEYDVALAMLEPLAEAGDLAAQSYVAFMYKNGLGAAEADDVALAWYTRAAEAGHALAQYSLATMYRTGEGTDIDVIQALVWYALAADAFPASDPDHLNKAIAGRDSMAAIASAEQIAEANRLIRFWQAALSE